MEDRVVGTNIYARLDLVDYDAGFYAPELGLGWGAFGGEAVAGDCGCGGVVFYED